MHSRNDSASDQGGLPRAIQLLLWFVLNDPHSTCSPPYDDFMRRGIVGNDFKVLPFEPKHTSILTTLPLHHKDPFDHLMVAQAPFKGIGIVSGEVGLDPYGVTHLL
jgi:PIN domain nuclease of toxin-antitoxin system